MCTHLAYAFSSNAGQNGDTVCAWIKTNFPLTTGNLSSIKTSVHSPHHQIRNLRLNEKCLQVGFSKKKNERMELNTWRCLRNRIFHQKIDRRVRPGIEGLRQFVGILSRPQTIDLLKNIIVIRGKWVKEVDVFYGCKITQFSWIDFEMIGDEEWVINQFLKSLTLRSWN